MIDRIIIALFVAICLASEMARMDVDAAPQPTASGEVKENPTIDAKPGRPTLPKLNMKAAGIARQAYNEELAVKKRKAREKRFEEIRCQASKALIERNQRRDEEYDRMEDQFDRTLEVVWEAANIFLYGKDRREYEKRKEEKRIKEEGKIINRIRNMVPQGWKLH